MFQFHSWRSTLFCFCFQKYGMTPAQMEAVKERNRLLFEKMFAEAKKDK